MKLLKIDEDAHRILIEKRDEMKERGIENATISEAIRELHRCQLDYFLREIKRIESGELQGISAEEFKETLLKKINNHN